MARPCGVWKLTTKDGVCVCVCGVQIENIQCIAIIVSVDFKWPTYLKDALTVLRALLLDIELVSPECAIPLTYASVR